MKDKKLYCVGLFIAVLAFPIFGCVFKWRPDMITPYLLFLTLVAIFWYSYETRGLKKQMVLQNVLTLRPRLILYATPQRGRFLYWVKNIGNGAALDIHIEDHAFELPGPGEKMVLFYKFECQNILETNEESELTIKTGDREEPPDASTACLAQLERHTFELTLKYKNVHNQGYTDPSKLGEGMLQKGPSCR